MTISIDVLTVRLCESLPLNITILDDSKGYCTKPLLERDVSDSKKGVISKISGDNISDLRYHNTNNIPICRYCTRKSSDEYLCNKKTYTFETRMNFG